MDGDTRNGLSPADNFGQRLALVVGKHDEQLSILGFFNAVDSPDIRMVERGSSFGLPRQAKFQVGVCMEIRREKFESNVAFEFLVNRLVDNAHTARAESLGDAVMQKLSSKE